MGAVTRLVIGIMLFACTYFAIGLILANALSTGAQIIRG